MAVNGALINANYNVVERNDGIWSVRPVPIESADLLKRADMANPFSFLIPDFVGENEKSPDERIEYEQRDYPGVITTLSSEDVE